MVLDWPIPLAYNVQALPLMPNLLNFLVSLNPATPTYFGTTLQRDMSLSYYMNGFMYGFSWGVVSFPATAYLVHCISVRKREYDVSRGESDLREDALQVR